MQNEKKQICNLEVKKARKDFDDHNKPTNRMQKLDWISCTLEHGKRCGRWPCVRSQPKVKEKNNPIFKAVNCFLRKNPMCSFSYNHTHTHTLKLRLIPKIHMSGNGYKKRIHVNVYNLKNEVFWKLKAKNVLSECRRQTKEIKKRRQKRSTEMAFCFSAKLTKKTADGICAMWSTSTMFRFKPECTDRPTAVQYTKLNLSTLLTSYK